MNLTRNLCDGYYVYSPSGLCMGGCVVCAHASHGKRRNGTGISAELMQIVFAFSIWAGAVTWKATWLIPLLAHVLVNGTGGKKAMPV